MNNAAIADALERANHNVFVAILLLSNDRRQAQDEAYRDHRQAWIKDLKAGKPTLRKGRRPIGEEFDITPHLEWLRTNIDTHRNDELTAEMGRRTGLTITAPALAYYLKKHGIQRSPEAIRRQRAEGRWKK